MADIHEVDRARYAESCASLEAAADRTIAIWRTGQRDEVWALNRLKTLRLLWQVADDRRRRAKQKLGLQPDERAFPGDETIRQETA